MAEEKYYLEEYGYWNFTKYRESDLSGEGYLPDDNGHYYKLARAARDNGWRHLIPISPSTKACFVTWHGTAGGASSPRTMKYGHGF